MTDISLQVENGKIVAYDEQGNKVPVAAEAIAADELYTAQPATITIESLGNEYRAVHHTADISIRDPSYLTVLKWARDNLTLSGDETTGGRIHHAAGLYEASGWDSVVDGWDKGTWISGEARGFDTGNVPTGTGYASLIKSNGGSAREIINLDGQFSGISHIGIAANDNHTTTVRVSSADCKIIDSGITDATVFNLELSARQCWVVECWIEFSDFAGIKLDNDEAYISNNIFSGGSKNSEAGITQNVDTRGHRIVENRFHTYDNGIRIEGNSSFTDTVISDNLFREIGRQTSPANNSNTVFATNDESGTITLSNIRFEGNITDGESNNETDHVVSLDADTTVDATVRFDTQNHRRLATSTVVEDGGNDGYIRNGVGQEASSGAPTAANWKVGDVVEDTNNPGDIYKLLPSGSWTQIGT
jgi:hypothetical protein